MVLLIAGTAQAGAPCAALREVSRINRAALRELNSDAMRKLHQQDQQAWKRRDVHLQGVMDTRKWPGIWSESDDRHYTFKPADFDGDGRVDQMSADCGASSWREECLTTFRRGGGKAYDLEDGFVYLTRIKGRFYAVNDYYKEGGGGGFPETDISTYWRITSRGFVEVCG